MPVATVTLQGHFLNPITQADAAGSVRIEPTVSPILDKDGDTVLIGSTRTALVAGAFSIELPATDDANLSPTGFGYRLTAQLGSGPAFSITFELPTALGPTVNLVDLVLTTPVPLVTGAETPAGAQAKADAAEAAAAVYTDTRAAAVAIAAAADATSKANAAQAAAATDATSKAASAQSAASTDATTKANAAQAAAIAAAATDASTKANSAQAAAIAAATAADTAKLYLRNNADYVLTGGTDKVIHYVVFNDGTPSAAWDDRLMFYYDNGDGILRRTGGHNEYGEVRGDAAKDTTTAARFAGRSATHSVGILEVVEYRGGPTVAIITRTSATFNVPISLEDAPTDPSHATRKDYVDTGAYGAWTNITLDPTYATASGGGYNAPQVRTAPGNMLELRGRLTSVGAWVASTTVIGTLANTAHRPGAVVQLLIRASSTMANLIVNTDGTLVCAQAVTGGSNVSLEGLRYSK